jgi:hypothetical protein
MRINLDMDGVLADFTACMAAELGRPAADADHWDLTRAWGLGPGEFRAAFVAGVEAGRVFHPDRTPALEEGCEAARRLIGAGHEVRVVTTLGADLSPAGRLRAMKSKIEFLGRHRIEADQVHFTGGDKTHVLADAVVDDHPDVARWALPGSVNLLLAQPWNEEHGHPAGVYVRRCGWDDILRALL